MSMMTMHVRVLAVGDHHHGLSALALLVGGLSTLTIVHNNHVVLVYSSRVGRAMRPLLVVPA